MSKTGSIQYIVLLSLLGLVAVELRAEPMLIVEIHKHGFPAAAPGGSAVLQFVTEITDHTTQTVFGGMYSGADEGMTFDAPANLVDAFEIALSAPTGRFALTDGSHTPAAAPADWIWNMPVGTYTATQHAPRLGYGLTGYNLTRVAHRINSFGYFTQPGPSGGPRANIQQTIALYGEPIPEPSSASLMLVAWTVFVQVRRSTCVRLLGRRGDRAAI